MCSPLTYSIANCSKRVAIICLSFLVFSVQSLTLQSSLGIAISLVGIFCYNLAKHSEKQRTKKSCKGGATLASGPLEACDGDRHSLHSFYNV